MRYENPSLREHLAGAYALGALRGAARRRFERLLDDDAALRRLVVARQEELVPLALNAPDIAPPSRVRASLARAIATPTRNAPARWWQGLGFWRVLATANGALAAVLVAFIGLGLMPSGTPPPSELFYVGVLNDAHNAPTVALLAYKQPSRLEIQSRQALSVAPGLELRLWLRDADGKAQFLAILPAGVTEIALDKTTWQRLREARRLLITREAATAPPTTPGSEVLYEGVCVNLKKWSEKTAGE